MMGMTVRQRMALDFIRSCMKNRGIPPTVAEMCTALNIRSKGNIVGILKGLEDRGCIRRLSHKARGIEIVDDCHISLSAETAAKLSIYCKKSGRSANDMIEECVSCWLDVIVDETI